MSLELNKCPICLKTAVDYRQIELYSRFAQFINFPRCQLCYGVPSSHHTPEHRNAKEEIKILIDLVNYHLERSEKTLYYQPVNWRAITFALQVHQRRFTTLKSIIIDEKLGFPSIDDIKLQEIISAVQQSKIYELEDVQEEISLVQQHQILERNVQRNEKGSKEDQYMIQTGASKVKVEPKWEAPLLQKIEQNEKEKEKSISKDQSESKLKQDATQTSNLSKTITSISISTIQKELRQQRLQQQKDEQKKQELKKRQISKKRKQIASNGREEKKKRKYIRTKYKKALKNDSKLQLLNHQLCNGCQQYGFNEVLQTIPIPTATSTTTTTGGKHKQFKNVSVASVENKLSEINQNENSLMQNLFQYKEANQNQLEAASNNEIRINGQNHTNANNLEDIIFNKFRCPKKIIVDNSLGINEAKLLQIIRCFNGENIEHDKTKNDLKIFQYLQ